MKGYWIAMVDVSDPEGYTDYTSRAPSTFARFGAQVLARGGRSEALEGRATPDRTVVIEFPSYEQALACYRSEEYQAVCRYRQGHAEATVVVVEGVPLG
jgi:uncharacterized protein (DUF1330 family)